MIGWFPCDRRIEKRTSRGGAVRTAAITRPPAAYGGAGKFTLFRLLAGEMSPDLGDLVTKPGLHSA